MVGICEITEYESVRVSFVHMLPFVLPVLLDNTSAGARPMPKLYCRMHVMSRVLLIRIFMTNESIFGNCLYFIFEIIY
jgi:hypothetical protein